jgi:putative Mg2+ transporter-C (MgtC) family protein
MEPSGLGALLLAFALSSLIGFERELRQKSAGLRTHTLVGVGAALFTLAGRYGFPGEPFGTDPARIAAQVVTGIGFIGAGVIFTRRDGVRGLTTAATIWVAAAVGLTAGAGLPLLAIVATGMHMVVTFVYTPIVRLLPTSKYSLTSLEVSYRDGEGVLRDILSSATDLGYVVTNLDVARMNGQDRIVSVSLDAEGRRRPEELVDTLQHLGGVVAVRTSDQLE